MKAAEGVDDAGSDAISVALVLWFTDIAKRRGFLSREATAARFLLSANSLERRLKGDENATDAALEFAEAWHWLRTELTGMHALAVEGGKARTSLRRGPAARTSQSLIKQAIVSDQMSRFLASETRAEYRRNRNHIAGKILGPVNERLKEQGLAVYTAETLRKVVGELMPHESVLAVPQVGR